MSTKRITINDVTIGMRVATDVYTENDELIIQKNTILTDALIARLKHHNIYNIRILLDNTPVPKASAAADTKPSYYERLQNSPEFKAFKKEYLQKADSLKNAMLSIIEENAPIDTDKLLSQATELMSKSRTTLHVFDIIVSLKNSSDMTFTHSINVSLLAAVLGKWLGYPQEDIEALSLAGLLHDIGKQMIPQEILNKEGALTEQDLKILRSHTEKGYELLSKYDLDPRIIDAALTHHEKFDGTGYPKGLKGNEIKDFAKIIAIVDVYDAMTAKRIYHEPYCPFEVIRQIERDGYQRYDTHMLMVFLENVVTTYVGNKVILSNGMIGEVIMINKLDLSRPIVKISDDQYIDLSHKRDIDVVSIV